MNFNKQEYLCLIIISGIYLIQLLIGIGIDFDSLYYLSAANSFSIQHSFVNPDNTEFLLWPPLYPFILSVGISFFPYNFIISQFIFLVIFLVVILGVIKRSFSDNYSLIIFFIIALGVSILMDFKFVWSEMLFISLLYSYYYIFKFKDWESNTFYFLLFTFLGMLLPLQRTAAFFLFSGIWGAYFLLEKKIRMKLLYHSLISSIPAFIWHYYSVILSKSRHGMDFGGITILKQNVIEYSYILSRYFVPIQLVSKEGNWWIVLLVFLVTSLCFFFFYKKISNKGKAMLFGLLSYIILMIVTPYFSVFGGGHQETDRFLSIIYPLLILILPIVLERAFVNKKVIYIILIMLCCYQGLRFFRNYYHYLDIDNSWKREMTVLKK